MTDYSPEEYSEYRLQRALETIKEVETHIENEFWNTAVNRMYYACFYAVGALLIKHDVAPSTHSGVRQKSGLEVGQGTFYCKNITETAPHTQEQEYDFQT